MSETGRRTGSRPRGLRNFSLLERAITICDEPAVVRQRNRAKVINNCAAPNPARGGVPRRLSVRAVRDAPAGRGSVLRRGRYLVLDRTLGALSPRYSRAF